MTGSHRRKPDKQWKKKERPTFSLVLYPIPGDEKAYNGYPPWLYRRPGKILNKDLNRNDSEYEKSLDSNNKVYRRAWEGKSKPWEHFWERRMISIIESLEVLGWDWGGGMQLLRDENPEEACKKLVLYTLMGSFSPSKHACRQKTFPLQTWWGMLYNEMQ